MSRTYRRKDLMQKTDMEITNGLSFRNGEVEGERAFHKMHGDQVYRGHYDKTKTKKLFRKELSKKVRKDSKRRSIQDAMKTGESISRDHLNKKIKTPQYF